MYATCHQCNTDFSVPEDVSLDENLCSRCGTLKDLLAALQASRRTMQTIKDNTSRSDSMTLEQAQYKLCIMDGLLHERLKLLDAAIAKARTVPAH